MTNIKSRKVPMFATVTANTHWPVPETNASHAEAFTNPYLKHA
jgi:hypothetical protein